MMKIFKKKRLSYEEIIKQKIKEREEARLVYFNRSQELWKEIIKGSIEHYESLRFNIECMNQATKEITLLRSILEQARA